MGNKRNSGQRGSFHELVQAAGTDVLRKLVSQLAATRPDIRRECVDFLMSNLLLTASGRAEAKAEAALALWLELEADLADLDAYGGGDEGTEERVTRLLQDLSERLAEGDIPLEDRRALLDEVFPYIRSGNSGMDDALDDVAYAACYDDADLLDLAQRFESLDKEWPLDHARRIYRRLGHREKYLSLRARKMVYGGDYVDLATFFWEAGETEKALEVAKQGMEKATGRMDELRAFLADRALEAGNRQEYLEIQFAQAVDRLTVQSYKAFKELCSAAEWTQYESRVLAALQHSHENARLEVHMLRGEYAKAIAILSQLRYPRWYDDSTVQVAAILEQRFPEEVLAFYRTGLGNLGIAAPRGEYSRNAHVMLRLRHMWLDVMKTPEKWLEFARRVKAQNQRRPAFHEEFGRVIPGWKDL